MVPLSEAIVSTKRDIELINQIRRESAFLEEYLSRDINELGELLEGYLKAEFGGFLDGDKGFAYLIPKPIYPCFSYRGGLSDECLAWLDEFVGSDDSYGFGNRFEGYVIVFRREPDAFAFRVRWT